MRRYRTAVRAERPPRTKQLTVGVPDLRQPMSSPISSDRNEERSPETGSRNPFSAAIVAVQRSFLLFVAVVGLALIGIGMLLDVLFAAGLFAGMFGIWGTTALLCAGLGFVGVKLLQFFDA